MYSKILKKLKILSTNISLEFLNLFILIFLKLVDLTKFCLPVTWASCIVNNFSVFNLNNYLIFKKKTNMFSNKNETGIYEISKNKKVFLRFLYLQIICLIKKRNYTFFKNSNIICDLAKNKKNIILRKYSRKKK